MSDLPEGWAEASLAEVIGRDGVFSDGDWVESKDQDPAGGVRLIQLADVGDGRYRNRSARFLTRQKAAELGCTYLEPGDILIARMPEPLGRACMFPGDPKPSITVVDVCIVRPSSDGTFPRWLLHTINAPQLRARIAEYERGTTRKRISRTNLGQLELSIPPSAEQRRIAIKADTLLSEVNAARESLTGIAAILKRLRQSVLTSACSGRLTEEWRQRTGISEASGKSNDEDMEVDDLPALPLGWRWSRLDAFLQEIEAGRSFVCDERPPRVNEVGVVKVSAVTWGTYAEEESKTCTDPERIEPAFFIRKGDFLFSRANTIDLVGACVLVERTSRRMMLSDKILRLKFVGISPRWILLVLRSRHGRYEIERLATGNQQSMRNIGQERIRQIRIPVPPPDETDEALRRADTLLGVADTVDRQLATARTRADKAVPAILAKAFRGELVLTEAELARQEGRDYEPASILLGRIRRNKSHAVKSKAPSGMRSLPRYG